ncbi:PAS domain-containing sensor histidine kinase [Nocardioides dongkuii]|uniref:PAS domain-containing sensor histidine kinase n=1 Tax=Nocardioides dongkuii TaxID=2760089 RepID=UPI0015F997F7|nr:ATP-binding protein [Nocardioides dongkuii]
MTPSRVRAVLAVVLGASVAGHVAAARSWGSRRAAPGDVDPTPDGHALGETGERYRSLFEYHTSAVFSLDLEGRFTSVNAAAERTSGYTEDELRGMAFADLIEPDHLGAVAEAFLDVVGRRPRHLDTVILRADGSPTELSITGLPIVVGDEVVGVHGIAENVTERNRLQRELEEAHRSAQQASEAKSMFLANVSHEIRTPLTSMLASSELLAESDLDPVQVRLVETLHRSGQRLLRLVEEILDFSAIEAGKATVYDVPLDLRTVVLDAVALARPEAEEKGVRLVVEVDPTLPPVLSGDPQRIAQVLTNLLSNAVKFTAEGQVDVRVEVAKRSGPVTTVLFRVEDTGIGMTTDQQTRLFESFSQGDASVGRQYGGTGLGLAICRQLVTLMGGSIWASGTLGEGSTFAFVLPLVEPAST